VDGPADIAFARRLAGAAVPEALFGGRQFDGGLDLAAGHRVGIQQQGQEQLAGERLEIVPAQQAGGDGAPQPLGVGEEAPALGGQRELAAGPAGQPQVLGEVTQLVQVEQVVLGPWRGEKSQPNRSALCWTNARLRLPSLSKSDIRSTRSIIIRSSSLGALGSPDRQLVRS
jgi:hypothetical protein